MNQHEIDYNSHPSGQDHGEKLALLEAAFHVAGRPLKLKTSGSKRFYLKG